jgi:hypothetical protein
MTSPELTWSFTVGRVHSLGGTSVIAQIIGDGDRLEADQNGGHSTHQAENWLPLVLPASHIFTFSTKEVELSPSAHRREYT